MTLKTENKRIFLKYYDCYGVEKLFGHPVRGMVMFCRAGTVFSFKNRVCSSSDINILPDKSRETVFIQSTFQLL